MAFLVSKAVGILLLPSTMFLLVLVAGLALMLRPGRERLGRRLAWAGAGLLVVGGASPLANALRLPLEERFPRPAIDASLGPIAAIVVLGGAEDGRLSLARAELSLNEAAERVVEGGRLAHKLPGVRLVFSGGAGGLQETRPAAAEIADYWRQTGIAAERIRFEDRSLTTWENAVEAHRLLAPKPGERILLVTSAYHMPRAVGAFRRQGFEVVPYPVDYRLKDASDAGRGFLDVPSGLKRLDETVREWIGMLAYRLLGRSSAVFPAP